MTRRCRGRLAGLLAAAVLFAGLSGCTNRGDKGGAANPAELVKKLKDSDPKVRAKAADDLRLLGPETAKPAISDFVAMLGDADETCRLRASEVLGSLGEDAYLPLMEAAKSKDANVRAMSWMGITGLEAAVYQKHQAEYAKALAVALKDENVKVREGAANSFHKHNTATPDAYPVVVAALDDNDNDHVLCYLISGMRYIPDDEQKKILGAIPRLRKLAADGQGEVKGLAGSLLLNLEKIQKQ